MRILPVSKALPAEIALPLIIFSKRQERMQYQAHAGCNYYLGQLEYAHKQLPLARKYFAKARDLDGLRFRASEEFNGAVDPELVARYPNSQSG